jgi:hypothetical protein
MYAMMAEKAMEKVVKMKRKRKRKKRHDLDRGRTIRPI